MAFMRRKLWCQHSCVPCRGSEVESAPYLFPASRGCLRSSVSDHVPAISASVITSLPLNLPPPFSEDSCDLLGPPG